MYVIHTCYFAVYNVTFALPSRCAHLVDTGVWSSYPGSHALSTPPPPARCVVLYILYILYVLLYSCQLLFVYNSFVQYGPRGYGQVERWQTLCGWLDLLEYRLVVMHVSVFMPVAVVTCLRVATMSTN